MREAIAFPIEGMRQERLETPEPRSISTYMEVPA